MESYSAFLKPRSNAKMRMLWDLVWSGYAARCAAFFPEQLQSTRIEVPVVIMTASALLLLPMPSLCCIASSNGSSSSGGFICSSNYRSFDQFVFSHNRSTTQSFPPSAAASRQHIIATSGLELAKCSKLRIGSLSSSSALSFVAFRDCSAIGVSLVSSHGSTRRKEGKKGAMMVVAIAGDDSSSSSKPEKGRFYFNVTGFPFPLGPFLSRKTIRTEMVRGRIWLFEQEQALGFSSVATIIRMTVIKLESGGLWVHAPVGPTKECVQLLKELESPVEFIVLPTFAYEHKIFVAPFSRAFPRAQVWVAPRQWSWPLNLPIPFLGIFGAKILKDDDTLTPWIDEIDHKILSCPEVGIGPYVEVAFFDKKSRSLLVTDAVIFVPERPPKVIGAQALLSSAKNGLAVKILSAGREVPDDPVLDTPANRQKGWERMVLQILFLGPSDLLEPRQTFRKVSKKLIVSPIIKTLVYNKVPDKVKTWVDSITADWKFKQIIPCHFEAPVAADARAFRKAFSFIEDLIVEDESPWLSITGFFQRAFIYPAADMKTLSSLDEFLVFAGAVRKTVSKRKR